MTRKDYILIAKAITDTRYRIAKDHNISMENVNQVQSGVRKVAAHLSDALAADNPAFDQRRFLTACGYGATSPAD